LSGRGMVAMTLTLDQMLEEWESGTKEVRAPIATTIRTLAHTALLVGETVSQGALGAAFAGHRGETNTAGDMQRDLDVHADELFINALRNAPVAVYASEELAAPVVLDAKAPLALAIDPLDGSSNIEVNLSIGTIFSILPLVDGGLADPVTNFYQPGRRQLAAGFFIYGPQLSLVLTLGDGTHVYTWSERNSAFIRIHERCIIAPKTQEFAINVANYRHWDEEVRLYVDDCLKGADGPREKDFNMRWVASLVAEAYRILVRGGVFIYPGDRRKGYGQGRLRLVYEANPMAMIIEQAGGSATDTGTPILDLIPTALHQRTPLAFGASREVMWIGRYHSDPSAIGARSPLFGSRGLFRA
jgi:fructose-1,6-bisphosphatase I